MIRVRGERDLARLRRLALAAQGLLQTQPYGRGLSGARRAIQHLGYVQIDSISVVERAHHHVVHCRVPGFEPGMTDRLLHDRHIFEYWAHAAAFLPIDEFRFSLPYKHALRSGQVHWYRNPDRKLMTQLLARIRADGPIRSRDLAARRSKGAGWWDWKPAKIALEQLYMEGELMVSSRAGFEKTYDLTERVLPSHVDTRMPDMAEFAEHLLAQQIRCHAVVSTRGLTYQRRNTGLRNAMQALVRERLGQGDLQQVRPGDAEPYLVVPGALDSPLPRVGHRVSILSPFDNSVIQRQRLKDLFGYDYQIECYLPAARRRFGYFCLPLLFRDRFVGRMDCKVHRKRARLEIRSLHMECEVAEAASFVSAWVEAVGRFCQFQGCDSVVLSEVVPGRWAGLLRDALRPLGVRQGAG